MIVLNQDRDLFGDFVAFTKAKAKASNDVLIYGKCFDGDYVLGRYDEKQAEKVFTEMNEALAAGEMYEMPDKKDIVVIMTVKD